MHVFITGGTGLIGRKIVAKLRERGDDVTVLSRSAKAWLPPGVNLVEGDPTVAGDWLDRLAECDAVVHLAGESIGAHRWTADFKKKVLDSRVVSTRLIAERIAQRPNIVLVNASAVGYYGMFEDNPTEFVESDPPGQGFLADVCVAWEGATKPAVDAGARVAMVRTGFVLDRDAPAFKAIARPFRLYVGGRMGSGRQWISWIHLDDLVGLYLMALDRPDARGPINGTAPEPVTNWGMAQSLAAVLGKPNWLPVPKLALKLLLGEQSQLVTHGQRAMPAKAKELGYDFNFPLLEPALREASG